MLIVVDHSEMARNNKLCEEKMCRLNLSIYFSFFVLMPESILPTKSFWKVLQIKFDLFHSPETFPTVINFPDKKYFPDKKIF